MLKLLCALLVVGLAGGAVFTVPIKKSAIRSNAGKFNFAFM
jgi:hypothetical protein